jgi:hypothetical protein
MLQKGFGSAPGTIDEWANALDPAVSGHRAILLQGQGVLIASFPDLDAAVYVGDGNNAAVAAGGGKFYRASDAAGTTPNIAGPYLILPDARGVVPRGLDVAAAIDPDGASRFLGDIQVDAFQGHIFYSGLGTGNTAGGVGIGVYGTTTNDMPGSSTHVIGTAILQAGEIQHLTSTPKTDGVNGTPRTSSETVMHNRSTNFVIWF